MSLRHLFYSILLSSYFHYVLIHTSSYIFSVTSAAYPFYLSLHSLFSAFWHISSSIFCINSSVYYLSLSLYSSFFPSFILSINSSFLTAFMCRTSLPSVLLFHHLLFLFTILLATLVVFLNLASTWRHLSLLQDHIQEVLDKWTQIDDEIWAKVIVLERNRRVAKAYARAPVLTINGSDDGFDGFRWVKAGCRSVSQFPTQRSLNFFTDRPDAADLKWPQTVAIRRSHLYCSSEKLPVL
jgi:hypothetical protein